MINATNTTSLAATNLTKPIMVQQADIFSPGARMNYKGDLCTMLGVLATLLLFVPAIASVPGIGERLNWREWHLVQSKIGWLAFATATSHVLVVDTPRAWPQVWSWPAGQILPGVVIMAAGPAMFVILIKLLTMVPPVSWALENIRCGKWDKGGEAKRFAVYCMEGSE